MKGILTLGVNDDIELFNYSPLEKIMYAYDLVRNRVYVSEGEEDKTISRTKLQEFDIINSK